MGDKKFEVVGGVSIVHSGKKTIVQQEDFEKIADSVATPNVGSGDSAQDVFDRFSKLLYVVDVSGSMQGGIPAEESVKQYHWTPELLEKFRTKMRTILEDYEEDEEPEEEDDEDDEPEEDEEEDFDDTPVPEDPDAFDDEALKLKIVEEGLDDQFNIKLPANWNYSGTSRSKIQAVKDAARDFVHKRFEKFPDARVGVFEFDDKVRLLAVDGASEKEVLAAIDRFRPKGGTNIYQAVDRAVNDCQKRPSKVNANHIVLVSDGCDGGAAYYSYEDYNSDTKVIKGVIELLPKMKELSIVFDFIYIAGTDESAPQLVVDTLRKVCEETGGEFVVVKTEKDFVQKFLTASNRPLLAAPK